LIASVFFTTALAAGAFDHSLLDALLRRHVVNGMVDYDAFARAPEFGRYLASLERADPAALSPAERLALWINAYNAYTIELINRHRERDSIRNINRTAGLFAGHGPWREKLVRVGGQAFHLDNVEHDIIRKQFEEPRIHFALVCAAMGCPPLRSEAFTGVRLFEQLDDQARTFLLHSPTKNRLEAARRILYASPIIATHYRGDFGGGDASIGRYLSRFWPAGPEKALLESGAVRLVATEYDWTLNSQAKARGMR
jgi:hypothetical protein